MEHLQINVKGWPEEYVNLVKKYADELGADLGRNGLPSVPPEDRKRLAERGVIKPGTQELPDALKEPPGGESPSGVLDALLREREESR